MSKWIDKDLFGKFQEQKKIEKSQPKKTRINRSDFIWETPAKGTETQSKNYVGRFLPDPKGVFYKNYFYHMYKSGEKWVFVICPKSDNFDNYCPFCSVASKLYMGSAADKQMAQNYKRKQKFVSNFYIQDDPRDADREDEQKVNKTVKLYEFPQKVEMKLKEEITDDENGLGPAIFDPSAEGYSFIIKVLSTKPEANGKVWPDYTNSAFARKATALGSDEEIKQIMQQCIDINEYLDNEKVTEEEMIRLIKDEMLYDLIKDEYEKRGGSVAQEPDDDSAIDPGTEDEPEENLGDDADLIAELESM